MQTRTSRPQDLTALSDPVASAKAVGLRYVSDQTAGIRRLKSGKGMRYVDGSGKPVRDGDVLRRIRSLVIPPAWRNVWICPLADGHLQATGQDVKGRKQYRYHPRWREVRDQTKYNRMIAFGKVLPRVRQQVQQHMALPGLPKEKVIAAVVRLLEVSLIRVGNEEYARANKSFGLTTMRDQHVKVSGGSIHFHFRGKAGKEHSVDIDDPRLARIVKRCQDLPGQELFQYVDDDGKRQTIGSAEVNDYLKSVTGQDFTAKDFRTWAGTVLAARALQELEEFDSQAKAKKNIVRAVEAVSQMLGNTPTICRKCYVHPAVIESYLDGALVKTVRRRAKQQLAEALEKLRPEETAVLKLLESRLAAEEKGRNGFALDRGRARSGLNGTRNAGGRRVPGKKALAAVPRSWRS
jgi:DNA topoisomerase-1